MKTKNHKPAPRASAVPLAPVVSSPGLTDQLTVALRDRIRSGAWARGSRIPTEVELVDQLGVSRTVLREAVSRLRSEGLLVARQGAGVFVATEDVIRSLRFDGAQIGSLRSVLQVVELRRAVEAETAACAALRATPRQLRSIDQAMHLIADAEAAGRDGVAEDMAFHRAIAAATGNPYFAELFDFLEQFQRPAMRVTRTNESTRTDFSAQVTAEHEAIVDAIRSGDAERARRAAATHMDNAARRLSGAARARRVDVSATHSSRIKPVQERKI